MYVLCSICEYNGYLKITYLDGGCMRKPFCRKLSLRVFKVLLHRLSFWASTILAVLFSPMQNSK